MVHDNPADFIARFADHWASAGGARIEGLIAACLMLDESDGVSASELSQRLRISRGSVSTHTRQLVEQGFVRRVRKPGDRNHYFRMDADVWAGFLAAEQQYLHAQRALAEQMLPAVDPSGPAWRRLRNMRDYMEWVIGLGLPERWEQHKRERDGRGL